MTTDKLDARLVPYSSVVGGGLQLLDANGRARFQIAIFGTVNGITKEETRIISARIAELINQHGLEVPKR